MRLDFDPYSWRARICPVYLAVVPIAMTIAALMPRGLQLPLGGAAFLLLAPVAFFASQIVADYGRHLQSRLWLGWGGPPTTRFLRHANPEFNEITRERIYAQLRSFDLHVPTRSEQERDPRLAAKYYESSVDDLIRRTRDPREFPLLFKTLVEYGFRRNLLSLKPFGLPVASFAVVGYWIGVYLNRGEPELAIVAIVAGVFATCILLGWVVWVDERAVRLAADRYARVLLEASLILE